MFHRERNKSLHFILRVHITDVYNKATVNMWEAMSETLEISSHMRWASVALDPRNACTPVVPLLTTKSWASQCFLGKPRYSFTRITWLCSCLRERDHTNQCPMQGYSYAVYKAP